MLRPSRNPATQCWNRATLLEKEERDAAARTRLVIWDDLAGTTHYKGSLPTAIAGAQLRKALLTFAAPKHRAATDGPLGEVRPTPERLGQAFVELIERSRPTSSPRPAASTPPSWSPRSARSTRRPSSDSLTSHFDAPVDRVRDAWTSADQLPSTWTRRSPP